MNRFLARLVSRRLFSTVSNATLGQTLTEKIVQRYAAGLNKGQVVRSGDYVAIQPAHVMTHDNTSAVMLKFNKFYQSPAVKQAFSPSSKMLNNSKQPVFVLDHNVQDKSEANLKKYRNIEQFAKLHGIDFYPAGRGIGHQVMCEEGYAWPGSLVVASDSHSNMYGGVGCLGTPVVRTDAASIWATGRTWWQVPPIARVELKGTLPDGATGKDIIIALCGLFNKDEVLNYALEFVGEGVRSLSVEQRLTIANMTTEWGALTGLFPIDDVTLSWYRNRSSLLQSRLSSSHPRINPFRIEQLERAVQDGSLQADKNAVYAATLTLDLSTVSPHCAGPNSVKVMNSVRDLEQKRVAIQKAYIVSCVNSRVGDLREAAAVLRGKQVAKGVELYIAAASSEVQRESEVSGDWAALLAAGARPLPPGCGPCIGLGQGLLRDGEVGISATNRNFKGRMGSPNAQAYLASPAVVASSAVAGYICAPAATSSTKPVGAFVKTPSSTSAVCSSSLTPLAPGFPSKVSGSVVYCHQNNLNTDGIYPGKYTYNESMTPEQQAQVVMENYDSSFSSKVQPGMILVGGFNFGTGSSREQAATALKHKGLKMVIGGSFSETYKRNALNNGFLCIDSPALSNYCAQKFGTSTLTQVPGADLTVEFASNTIHFEGKQFVFGAVGIPAQELILCGGQEAWVESEIVKMQNVGK